MKARGEKGLKTSIELIRDLDAAQKKHRMAFLLVGFPTTTLAIPSTFDTRLHMLEESLQQGGVPVGIWTMQETTAGVEDHFDVLEEHFPWGACYMEAFVKKLESAEPGEVVKKLKSAEPIEVGIDEFRIRQ